jgi:hypothetical protein
MREEFLQPNSSFCRKEVTMKIVTNANPPEGMRKHRNYAVLVEALRINDGWVAVSTSEISGTTNGQRQTAIHAACQRAGFRIETRTTETELFIRTLKSSEAPHAN